MTKINIYLGIILIFSLLVVTILYQQIKITKQHNKITTLEADKIALESTLEMERNTYKNIQKIQEQGKKQIQAIRSQKGSVNDTIQDYNKQHDELMQFFNDSN